MANKTELKLQGTNVLDKNLKAFHNELYRFIVNQGGTRSSKTYSIAQMWVILLMQETDAILTITRKTMPSLRSSVMRDFFEVLKSSDLYDENLHNKSDNTYILHRNIVEFVSLDQPQKKRGAKRKYLWMNEANEFTYEDFMQMNMRTQLKVVLDYNPSDEFHWIYDKVIPRANAVFIKSTYLDNPFLERSLIAEIEELKNIDDTYWKIYGLGEKGGSSITIYTNWDEVPEFPENVDDLVYGIDFGYNNPSVVLKIGIVDGREAYIKEELYQTKLTNSDLIEELKNIIPENKRNTSLIKADSSEPDRIEEINRAGFWCEPCRKGKGSVKDGIDTVKRYHVHIVKGSPNLLKEEKYYKWRVDKDGHVLDEPVKFMDHAQDAKRYAIGDMEPDIIEFVEGGDTVGRSRDTALVTEDGRETRLTSMGEDRDTAHMDEELM